MARTAIATDSNSGITQSQAKELGVFVLPMPFFMRGKIQFEDIDLTQEQFLRDSGRGCGLFPHLSRLREI